MMVCNRNERTSMIYAYEATSELNIWSHLRDHGTSYIRQYLFSSKNMKSINMDKLIRIADRDMRHTRASLLATFRHMVYIARHGLERWKTAYIEKHRTDKLRSIRKIQRHWKRSLSDPNFSICKKRLIHEFDEMHRKYI
jgi:hypothetical protein